MVIIIKTLKFNANTGKHEKSLDMDGYRLWAAPTTDIFRPGVGDHRV